MKNKETSVPLFNADKQTKTKHYKRLAPSIKIESDKHSKIFTKKIEPRFLNINETSVQLKKDELSKLRDSNKSFKYNYTQYKKETKTKSICEYNPEFLNDTFDEKVIKIYKNRGYNIPKITNTRDLFKNTPINMKKFEIKNFYFQKQHSRNKQFNFDNDKNCKYLDKINYLVQRVKNDYIHQNFLKRFNGNKPSIKLKNIKIPKKKETKNYFTTFSSKTNVKLSARKREFFSEMKDMKTFKNYIDVTFSELNSNNIRRSIILKSVNNSNIQKQLFNNMVTKPIKLQKKNSCKISRINNISDLYSKTKSIFGSFISDNISDLNKTKYNNIDYSMDTNLISNTFSYNLKNNDDDNKYKKISDLYEKISKKINFEDDKEFIDEFYRYFSEYKDLPREEVSNALKGISEPIYMFNIFSKLKETIKDKDEGRKWKKAYLSVGKLGNQKSVFKKMGKCDNLIKRFPQIYIRNIKGVKESKDFCI